MQLISTIALLATVASTALAAPAPSASTELENVSITDFYAKHIAHGVDATVSFNIKHISGAGGWCDKEIHCCHTLETSTSNGLAAFNKVPCDEEYSFAFEQNPQGDWILMIYDGDLEGAKVFGPGSYYENGGFKYEYIASKGYFDVQLSDQ